MPNWCKNTLQVSGPDMDVKRFRDLGKRPGTQTCRLMRYIPFPVRRLKTGTTSAGSTGG